MTERFDGAAEERLAILALAVYRYISRAVKDFAEYRIREETGWILWSVCHHREENV
jgi:hypothetical protein